MKFFFSSLVIASCMNASGAQKPPQEGTIDGHNKMHATNLRKDDNVERRTDDLPRQWQPRIVG